MDTNQKPQYIVQKIALAAVLALPFGIAMADGAPAMPAPGGYGSHGGAAAPGADAPLPPAIDGRMGMGPGFRGPGMQGGPGMPGRGPRGADGERGHPGHPGHPPGPGHFGPPPGGPGMPPPFLHGLNLTDAQQDKVFAIVHGQAPAIREQERALRKAREALHALATAAQYDDAKAAAQAQAAAQAMANLELSRVRMEQKVLAVLTAEQRKQVGERLAAMAQRGPRS